MKPPVHVQSELSRNHDGSYRAGACFDRGSWVWAKLQARRRDVAAKQLPEAVAHLMVERAKLLEQQASDLMTKAAFLRDCARMKGVM